ncbi:oligosaccharide flippase family protein [Paenibacillus sp. SC116]|uniref:putative polysaccharide biosynthesis protein n=1 Tax=Paenibacillus sp. SC116 TaxID=2968986 RepID=UPI00215AEB6B|nr:oligosaccharide flippase family protein [Paenibacillus sp. SC116]MCR8846642.1 oligosaccharide flippase family protein [Paenibacillus sp. SC116]
MKEQHTAHTGVVVQGALLLGLATVTSKLLGTLQKIPLQNIAGDGVFGIYNTVYPFYILLTVIATAGIPVAVARLVADAEADHDRTSSYQIAAAGLMMMSISGVVGFIAMYLGAGTLAGWIGNMHTEAAIRASSFAMLILPVLAVLRGYDQGRGRMVTTAVSQVIEQTARVIVMIMLLFLLYIYESTEAEMAAGATFGSFAGALFAFIVLLITMGRRRWRAVQDIHAVGESSDSNIITSVFNVSGIWLWMKRLAWTALPICLGAIVVPMMNVVDTFTLPRLLHSSGWSEMEAMEQLGVYSRAFPLVQLVTMVASSLAVGLVPALVLARRSGDAKQVQALTAAAMKWTWLLAAASAVGLTALAAHVNAALYMEDKGTLVFVLVSCTALPGALQAVCAAMLQGVGAVVAPALHLLAAALVKVSLNVWLVPTLGLEGAALSALASLTVAAMLGARALARAGGAGPAVWAWGPARLALALAAMGGAVWLTASAVAHLCGGGRGGASAATAIGVLLGAILFGALAVTLRLVRPAELAALPKVGQRLAALAARLTRVK